MLSRRPRSWAIPGRGIWAGLALTPLVIALALLIAAAVGGGSTATAGPTVDGTSVSQSAAKARSRVTHHATHTDAQIRAIWTPEMMAAATDVETGKHVGRATPDGTPGSPHTTFTYYASFRATPTVRNAIIFFCQPGPCARPASNPRVCSGGVIGWDDPATTVPNNADTGIEGPTNVVWTAGRCLHQGFGGEAGWSDDLIVCPAFNNGAANSLGCWTYANESTTPEWYTDNWESRDYGVLYLNPATQPGNAPIGGCTNGPHQIAYAYSGGSVPAPNCNVRIRNYNFAYNVPRAEHWWVIDYHDPITGLPPPPPACTPPTGQACGVPRVTQAQYAYTHVGLTSNPAGAPIDTGPGPNSIGGWQNAGTDGNTGAAKVLGKGTGGPWILGTTAAYLPGGGYQANEARFGVARINSNTSYADVGEDDQVSGQQQGPYFDTLTCFDYQAWTDWPGTCS